LWSNNVCQAKFGTLANFLFELVIKLYQKIFQMPTNCLTNESNETHDFDAKLQAM
jgi:hypothetical protein